MQLIKLYIFLVVLCFSTTLPLINSHAQTIEIATGEYDPFTSSEAKHSGFVNRVITEAFMRKGVTATFKYLPWKRAFEEGRIAKRQAVSFSFTNPEREADFLFSAPISEHREVLFHLKSTQVPSWSKIQELSEFKFGATRGYSYTNEFWDAQKAGQIKVEQVAGDEQNFKKVARGRIDLFPMDETRGWILLNNKLPENKDKLTTHETPLSSTTGHLIISKKTDGAEKLMADFNEGLKEMREDGTYEKFKNELFSGVY